MSGAKLQVTLFLVALRSMMQKYWSLVPANTAMPHTSCNSFPFSKFIWLQNLCHVGVCREAARICPFLTEVSWILTAPKGIVTINLQRSTVCPTIGGRHIIVSGPLGGMASDPSPLDPSLHTTVIAPRSGAKMWDFELAGERIFAIGTRMQGQNEEICLKPKVG